MGLTKNSNLYILLTIKYKNPFFFFHDCYSLPDPQFNLTSGANLRTTWLDLRYFSNDICCN